MWAWFDAYDQQIKFDKYTLVMFTRKNEKKEQCSVNGRIRFVYN